MAKLKVPQAGADETQLREYALESAGYQSDLDAMLSEIVGAQLEHYKAMEPIWLQEQGLQKTVNEDGSYTYTPVNQELYDKGREIEQLAQDRTLAALKGELPVSPGLERDIADQDRVLRERLNRQFGEGYENSTPGAYQLMEFGKRSNEAREAERRGEIANAMNLTAGAQNVRANRSNYDPTGNAFGNQTSAIGAGSLTFGNSGTNYINAQSPYQFDRDMQFQKNLTKYAAKKELQGALIGGGMQLGSQLLGTAAGKFL